MNVNAIKLRMENEMHLFTDHDPKELCESNAVGRFK